jgi:hypothetical protein
VEEPERFSVLIIITTLAGALLGALGGVLGGRTRRRYAGARA